MAESSEGAPRPERIGPYDILEVLGSGGMGVVYRARDPRLSRDVALKVIRRTNEADPRWRQRFADEARAAAALNHPNILAVHDVAIDVDSPYIVSELIDGGSLRQVYPLGAGTARTLDRGDVVAFCPISCPLGTASFASPGLVLFGGQRADRQRQTFTQSIEGGPPLPVSHEPGLVVSPVAQDGRRFVSQRADGSLWVATLTPEPAVRLPFSLSANQRIRQWTDDGQELFVLTIGDDRDVLERVHVRTGRRTTHAEVARAQPSIRDFRSSVRVSRDGRTIPYTDGRQSSTLFLVQGIR